ncbi:hypothetical protein HY68_01355 [Streptomyces sp. AcH 505]|nr:hypothetical protein HY68_01355 [Streptomyces sp. AcH 505]
MKDLTIRPVEDVGPAAQATRRGERHQEPSTRAETVTGEARVDLRDLLAERYRAGESVRELAERVGRSYGSVHQLLKEAGVKFRSRRRWS